MSQVPIIDRWSFLPYWLFSLVLSLASVWVGFFLEGINSRAIHTDPLRDGSLYVFSIVFLALSLGAIQNDAGRAQAAVPPRGVPASLMMGLLTLAFVGLLLSGAVYASVLLTPPGETPTTLKLEPFLGLCFAAMAAMYGLSCEYLRHKLSI
jgi:hypothetical protein